MLRTLLLSVLLTGCGGPAPETAPDLPAQDAPTRDAPGRGTPRAGAEATPAPDPHATSTPAGSIDEPAPLAPMRIVVPVGDGPALVFEVFEGGALVSYLEGNARPTAEASVVALRADWTLFDRNQDRVVFSMSPDQGSLLWAPDPHGTPQDMQCHLVPAGELRCRCDGHTPVRSERLAVDGDRLVGFAHGYSGQVASVHPAPTTAAARLQALFVFATHLITTDATSHDGDFGMFDGEH